MTLHRSTKKNLTIATACTALLIALQFFDDNTASLLRYENTMIDSGEWWRLISGHFIHLGWTHLSLNVAAMWLLIVIFQPATRPEILLSFIFLLSIGTSIGLIVFSPEVEWYVGLSGVLHGLLLMGIVVDCRYKKSTSLILLTGLIAKLLWEQFYGDAHAMKQIVGGMVVYDAHLYGAITGAALIAMVILIPMFFPVEK